MPSLAVCQCLFRLMRHCFLGRWICLSVSERFRQVWRCRLFDYSTYILFCVRWHGGQCLRRLVPNYAVVFRLGWCICQYRYIIGVVGVGNCFCGVSSVSFLSQLKAVFSDFINRMKRSFFQAAVVSILLYGCTNWMLTKRLEKKLDGNYIRMLRVILNKSWRQHPIRHQLYGHLPPITKIIQVRRTRHAGHCWRSRDELISDVLLWTPAYGQARAGRTARTYIQQLCENTGCSPEDLSEAMNDRQVRSWISVSLARHEDDIYIYIYIYISVFPYLSQSECMYSLNLTTTGKMQHTANKLQLVKIRGFPLLNWYL